MKEKDELLSRYQGLIAYQRSGSQNSQWYYYYQHFVLKGEFDKTQAAFFSKLMNERIDDDYSDFLITNFEDIEAFIAPAKEYFVYIEKLIKPGLKAK